MECKKEVELGVWVIIFWGIVIFLLGMNCGVLLAPTSSPLSREETIEPPKVTVYIERIPFPEDKVICYWGTRLGELECVYVPDMKGEEVKNE